MEDRKKIVERILTELHHGNFHPVIPSSELSTPEQEEPPSLPQEGRQTEITLTQQDSRDTTSATSKVTTPVERSPERKGHLMELSHISLAGTPMINRPCSDNFDDDLFHFTPKCPAKGKVITSSGELSMCAEIVEKKYVGLWLYGLTHVCASLKTKCDELY